MSQHVAKTQGTFSLPNAAKCQLSKKQKDNQKEKIWTVNNNFRKVWKSDLPSFHHSKSHNNTMADSEKAPEQQDQQAPPPPPKETVGK